MPVEFNTPVGRIVWGNPSKSTKKTDQKTKQPILRDGKEVEQWVFGVAFPKAEFEQKIWPYMHQEAASVFPHGVPQGFSWKYKDGDSVDKKGKPYAEREGYAGHYVLTVSTEAFAPPIYKFENGSYRQLQPEEIKTGDYVTLALSLKANAPTNPTHTPGIYINPVAVNHVGYGQEIISGGADPEELFGNQPVQLPPGASAMPVASGTNVAMPGTMPQAAPAAGYTQPVQYATTPAQPLPAPAHDYVQNAGQARPAPAAMPQAMPTAGMPGTMPPR